VLIKTVPSVPSSTCKQIDNSVKFFIACDIGKFIRNVLSFQFSLRSGNFKAHFTCKSKCVSARTSLRFRVLSNRQGLRDWVQAPVKFFIPPPPPSQQARTIGSRNKGDSVVWKMAAGRKCRHHEWLPPNYTWYYRERQYHMQKIWAPVIWTRLSSFSSTLLTEESCHTYSVLPALILVSILFWRHIPTMHVTKLL